MAFSSFRELPVPAGSEKALAVLTRYDKAGNLAFTFRSLPQQKPHFEGGVEPAHPLNFNVYESDDKKTWGSPLNSALVEVAPGGEQTVVILSNKKFLKIAGYGTNGGGYAKVDVTFNGSLYYGQIDWDLNPGKSGFGVDGGAQPGVADLSASAWPKYSV